jgi:ribosomal protein L12E/L44/L45/RPP1/RPP2
LGAPYDGQVLSVLEKLAAERALRDSIDAIDNPPMAPTAAAAAEDYSDDFAAYADFDDEDEDEDENEDEETDGVIVVT